MKILVIFLTLGLASVVNGCCDSCCEQNTEQTGSNDCPATVDFQLTDLSSTSQMESNGWSFDTNYDATNWNQAEACNVHDTWYGFKSPGDGTVTATFTGSGSATLDYGNCWTQGYVSVYLNGELKDGASPNTPSKIITFNFSPNDVLVLEETGECVIKLNSLELGCVTCACLDFVTEFGNGNCQTTSNIGGHNDMPVCYVKQPSNCLDLVDSSDAPGNQYSAEACQNGCTVNGLAGDGSKRGSCREDHRCLPNGNCESFTPCCVRGSSGDGKQQGSCDEGLVCTPEGACVEREI